MKRKYKVFLLISNLALIFFGLNIFLKIIDFQSTKVNPILILICCLLNMVIGVKTAIEAANNK